MQKYKKYHTNIKTCYALGIHHEILPEKFIKEIPSSTSHYWKYEDPKKYIRGELAKGIQDNLEDTKVFLDSRLYFSRKAFIQLGRLYITLVTLLGKDNIRKIIKANRNVFVDLIENISEDFTIAKKDLLRFLMISKKQYAFWLNDRKFVCALSPIGQCFKRRPMQISNREIDILKKYMNRSAYKTGCIRSIWERLFGIGRSLWRSLHGTGTHGNSVIPKPESLRRNPERKVLTMQPDLTRHGIWISPNTEHWIMWSFTSTQW